MYYEQITRFKLMYLSDFTNKHIQITQKQPCICIAYRNKLDSTFLFFYEKSLRCVRGVYLCVSCQPSEPTIVDEEVNYQNIYRLCYIR